MAATQSGKPVARYSTDAKLIMAAGGIRGFGYGFVSIVVILYLGFIGFSTFTIGLLLSLSSFGSSAGNILVSRYADKIGRRRSLKLFAIILTLSGVVLLATTNVYAIAVSFVLGGITATGQSQGPYQSIEQSSLTQSSDRSIRNYVFSFYNVSSSLLIALGFLFVRSKGVFEGLGLPTYDAYHVFFLIYVGLGLALIALYSGISSDVEVARQAEERTSDQPKVGSKEFFSKYSTIMKLSAVFGFDSFGSGFTGQNLINLWLITRFGFGASQLSILFFVSQLAQTASYLLTARIANRVGLVRTMILTQIPSNMLLALLAFSPTGLFAEACFLARAPLFQIDIPARQAYTMSVVPPEQRTAAAAITGVTRNGAQTVSPGLGAYLLQIGRYSDPILIGASLKMTYVGLLYYGFRHQREL